MTDLDIFCIIIHIKPSFIFVINIDFYLTRRDKVGGILISILYFWDLLMHRFSSPTQNILFTESLFTYNRPTSEQRETTVKVQMKNLQLSCWVLWHDEDESGFRRQKKFKSVSNETYCSQATHQTVHYIALKNSFASLSSALNIH